MVTVGTWKALANKLDNMIKGLYETHLFVEDIDRSIDFYANKMELEQCHYEAERRAAFFWIGSAKQSMLGLWEKPKSEIESRHFAFACDPDWVLNESIDYLKNKDIHCWNFLNDGTQNPLVFAWVPAVAIFFNDPDGHLLEFIGILDGASKPENGIITHAQWKELEGK